MLNLLDVLLFGLLAYSINVIWSYADIFNPVRLWIYKLIPNRSLKMPFLCPNCNSFWCGVAMSFIYNPLANICSFYIVSVLLCGIFTHLIAFFLNAVYGRLTQQPAIKPDNIHTDLRPPATTP